jgi:predicted CXXCH cytochrome family protein
VKHQPVENGECTSCHNPHQSDNKKLVAKAGAKLCYECHDDLQQAIAKAPFKHDPAGNGECAACHNPHQSGEAALLLKDGRQLCFECHEEKDMDKVGAHAQTSGQACASCHDPHGGKDKYLLKPASAKPAAAVVPPASK